MTKRSATARSYPVRIQGPPVGPLAPTVLEERRRWFAAKGYSPGSAAGAVNLARRLSVWMQEVGADVGEIDEELLDRFVTAERSRDRPCSSVKGWMGALRRFLAAAGYLRAAGVNERQLTPAQAAVTELAVERGASVRLIGDDRQLAAIGAGGVLRDIATTHGVLRLDELVRFSDAGEGEASLALRDGDLAALGFYLDNDRVHVGDVGSCLDDVFAAWSRERAGGRDCLILAPTRDLVRELNLRAQASWDLPGASVGLADGRQAHAGDVVISRRNDRRLGVSGTDWVKNGDRWIVTDLRADGTLSVRQATSRLHATQSADYVREHVELGYASTVHTAQGITTDIVHGIVTGPEDRQMLYTMLTRGRVENHAHIVLDVDATHVLPSPSVERALTATEVLEGILARDGAAVSATSTQARAASPAALLQDAVARYADAVALATSKLRGEPADGGPLPWLAGIPDDVAAHPSWGPYLAARSRREPPGAAGVDVALRRRRPHSGAASELAVWRAAVGVPEDGRTMAGAVPHDDREASYHRHLIKRINARYGEAVQVWPTGSSRTSASATSRPPSWRSTSTSSLARATPRNQRRPTASVEPFPRSPQRDVDRGIGL